ncbi:MotA/TolQ/ExbB proton channel family protein [Babesia caballi]|uniref:MotA/TolQ/ExbB proton channel family protein n=1 Tax=Babesia caballi TaxID=5871 RepID=A0AAV4LLX7_BABCB|nr:MotA/TolQ/ExbB proton channel family protein [Babesia caballi]
MRKHYVVSGMKHVVPCRVGLGTGAISSRITALGLFDGLSGWFSQAFGNRWYVPPMPTGEFSSTLLRKKGELQSEKDTQEFFETIGVKRDASLFEISRAYEHALDTLPEDMRGILQHAFHEFLRKEFVNAFEHMETFIKRGPAAWEEYWDPSKDAFGNPVTTVLSPEEEDKIMEKRMPPELDVTKFRDFWRKRSSRFGTIMSKVDMASRLRLTCNFGGRLVRCATTMVPVMLLGFFPQFSSTSLALQGLLASGFIFKGDRAVILEREKVRFVDTLVS